MGFSSLLLPLFIIGTGASGSVILVVLKKKRNNRDPKNLVAKDSTPRGFGYFDKMLGGGILPGSTVLILGNPGSGKSILCQYLAYRFLSEGKACVFISYDEMPAELRKRSQSFNLEMSKFEQDHMFSIVDCYSSRAKVASQEKYYVEQPFSLTDLSITISTVLEDMQDKSKVLFLDSGTSLFTKLEFPRVMRFLQDRSAKIKANGDLFIFTLGKGIIAQSFANQLEEAVDGIIELDFAETQGKRSRRMRIKKLRGQGHLDEWATFTIDAKQGITFVHR
jgi:KaiC/GvpD/RAD55 family RecA-like ATPase